MGFTRRQGCARRHPWDVSLPRAASGAVRAEEGAAARRTSQRCGGTAFPREKKKRKGMGSSSLGDRRGWDPSGRAHLLQAILRPLCFPGISWSQGYRVELLQIPRFWDLLTARRAPEPLCTPSGNVADEGVPAPLRPGESFCRLGAGGGGAWIAPEILRISRTPPKKLDTAVCSLKGCRFQLGDAHAAVYYRALHLLRGPRRTQRGARPEGRGSTGTRDPRPLAAPSSAEVAGQRLRGRERSCLAGCRRMGHGAAPREPGASGPRAAVGGRAGPLRSAASCPAPLRPHWELQPGFRPGSLASAPAPAPAGPFRPPLLAQGYGRSIRPGPGRLGNEQSSGTATSGC